MVNVVIMQHASPDDYATSKAALVTAQGLVDSGAKVLQIFFYGPGVLYASRHLSFPSGVQNAQQQWREFAVTHDIPLVVCSTVANQYGIEPSAPPAGSLAVGFSSGGLTEFMEAISHADTLLQFSSQQGDPAANTALSQRQLAGKGTATEPLHDSGKATLLFEFNHSPWHAISRHGLDMLLMAVSLDIPCQALYHRSALSQLVSPNTESGHNPLKKIAMLNDVFDFTAFYCSTDDFEHTEEHPYRVPLQQISAAQIERMKASAKHRIIF